MAHWVHQFTSAVRTGEKACGAVRVRLQLFSLVVEKCVARRTHAQEKRKIHEMRVTSAKAKGV